MSIRETTSVEIDYIISWQPAGSIHSPQRRQVLGSFSDAVPRVRRLSFQLPPHRAALPSLGAPLLRGTAAVRMADGEKPMKSANESPLSAVTDKLSTVPWNDLLLGFVTVDCAQRLSSSVPALFGPEPNFLGSALDVLFVGYGTLNLAKKAGILKSGDYYAELEGGDVRSFAFEAGEFALADEVPFRTKVLHYAPNLDPNPSPKPTPTPT